MQAFTKTILVTLYPLLVLARLANHLLGFDRLRLQNLPAAPSYWIERRQPDLASYFSEASQCEGSKGPSVAKIVSALLGSAARLYRPRRRSSEIVYKASAEREQGIPDEVYTLW
jgi:hypothetical protein